MAWGFRATRTRRARSPFPQADRLNKVALLSRPESYCTIRARPRSNTTPDAINNHDIPSIVHRKPPNILERPCFPRGFKEEKGKDLPRFSHLEGPFACQPNDLKSCNGVRRCSVLRHAADHMVSGFSPNLGIGLAYHPTTMEGPRLPEARIRCVLTRSNDQPARGLVI
jgi:hypothetical protein